MAYKISISQSNAQAPEAALKQPQAQGLDHPVFMTPHACEGMKLFGCQKGKLKKKTQAQPGFVQLQRPAEPACHAQGEAFSQGWRVFWDCSSAVHR